MVRIDCIWLALGASDLRGGIDKLLAQVVHGFALGAQAHHAYVFANRRADRLKVLVFDGVGIWLCTRRLQSGGFEWPREDTGCLALSRKQFDWLVGGLPWQRLGAPRLHAWLLAQRQALAKSDVTAKAIDYSLSNWRALTRYLDDGNVPIDNNAVENSIRPLAIGRRNWLFVGSQQAGERAAVMLSLIESAKLNGHDPWAYLKDVFERLPTLKNRDLELLLPHNWRPADNDVAPAASATAPATVAHSDTE